MEDDEIKSLFENDKIEVPECEFNSRKMLQKCKMQKIASRVFLVKTYMIVSSIMIILFVSLSVMLSIVSTKIKVKNVIEVNNISSKIQIERSSVYGEDAVVGAKPTLGQYGIEVYIVVDYSKHPKYDEWIAKYGLKGVYSSTQEKRYDRSEEYDNKNYYYLLSGAYYETIKDGFSLGVYYPSYLSEEVILFYFAKKSNDETIEEAQVNMQEMLDLFYSSQDYLSLLELTNEDIVEKIIIKEAFPKFEGWDA